MMIRSEEPRDEAAVRRVEEAAFGRPVEAGIVDALRAGGGLLLSLVAEDQGQVLGHIAFSPAEVIGEGVATPVVCLGPVAVEPQRQKGGVGGALIRAGLSRLADQGHGAVLLFGHPPYHHRFGFAPASNWGIRWDGVYPDEAFMALELKPGALAQAGGVFRFRPEFAQG